MVKSSWEIVESTMGYKDETSSRKVQTLDINYLMQLKGSH